MDKIKQMIKKLDGKTFSLASAIRNMEKVRREYSKIKKIKQIEMDLKFE